MDYNKEKESQCKGTTEPALIELNQDLQSCANKLDAFTIELKEKLQTIKLINKSCPLKEEEKGKKTECIMDDLNNTKLRFYTYIERLEDCLMHLNQII